MYYLLVVSKLRLFPSFQKLHIQFIRSEKMSDVVNSCLQHAGIRTSSDTTKDLLKNLLMAKLNPQSDHLQNFSINNRIQNIYIPVFDYIQSIINKKAVRPLIIGISAPQVSSTNSICS